MDSSLGLDYIVENKEFTGKLASALNTEDVTVKKQVFELLSALCVYSKDGYARALDAVEQYKLAKKQKYRFSTILEELRSTDNLAYKNILLEFINCVIIYTDKISDRIRIRNEFYGLKLQEILNQLRSLAEKDTNIATQLDVFDDQKANDDEQLPGAKGVDLNCPLDVFYTIYKQVCDTPQEIHFLTTLQHLLKIDPSEKSSQIIWETVESLVSKATVIESPEDSKKVLQSFIKKLDNKSDCKCTCSCHKDDGDRHRVTSPRRKLSGVQTNSTEGTEPPPPVPPRMTSPPASPARVAPPPPPPPPPPPSGGAPPPPPPPPPPGVGAPPPPPPPSGGGFLNRAQKKLPQQNTPKPKSKMRTLQWQKIPVNKVMGKANLWTMTGQLFNGYVNKMDYEQIEDLFSVNKVTSQDKADGDTSQAVEKKKKESAEVNIIDGKRSLNVNIFLKQFRLSNEEIVQLLQEGSSEKFGAEKLRNLHKILPSAEEVDLFRGFDGDRTRLGSAEKFFMCLMGLPNYRLRIEGLLIKEEYSTNIEFIRPSIDSVIEAAKDIKENKNLHELLYLVLLAGNYLNSGNYAGDAAGFKLSSLLKLAETRANKPRMNLMHYVSMQAEEKNPKLLNLPGEMKFLKDASLASVDSLTSDVKQLDENIQKIQNNVNSAGNDFKQQMEGFLQMSSKEMSELKEDLKDIESLRLELSDFFCEDEKTFKLEECFKILQTFCERFNKAILENAQRRDHEAKMKARRQQKEAEELKRNSADLSNVEIPDGADGEGSIVEKLLADVRSGFKKYGETSFSVTKVQKINLENAQGNSGSDLPSPADTSFIRGGTGRRSMRGRKKQEIDSNDINLKPGVETDLNTPKTRRSYAVDTDGTLFDILMQPEKESESPATADSGNFSRVGSLRRRRENRYKGRDDLLGRERAASPNIEAQKEKVEVKERPKSDILDDNFDFMKGSNSVRRSRSMNERTTPDGTPKRMYDPNNNNNKSEDNLAIKSSLPDDVLRRSSRWRSEIPELKSLPIIDEKTRLVTPTKEIESIAESDKLLSKGNVLSKSKDDSYALVEQKNKEKISRRFSSSNLDHNEIRRVLETAEDVKMKTDEHSIALSVRSKINKRWKSELDKTDIDKVLKAIEETGKQIDEMVPIETKQPSETVTATVTPNLTDKKVVPQGDPNEPENLKVKRNMRKKRSTLSMDDIHAAFKSIDTNSKEPKNVPSSDSTAKGHTSPPPKSPSVPPRRSRKNSDGTIELIPQEELKTEKNIDRESMSKAAKLAGKKRFRDQRFGDKDAPQKASNEPGRCKSNVEKENVDEAIRDYLTKNNMSRSKSYDEAVARKAMCDDDGEFNREDKRNSLRNSSAKLFTDGRRNGRIFTDDDSDADTAAQSSSPRRPSSTASTRSDSPRSSRLSIKSTNTSTETLRETCSDSEASPEQKRKDSVPKTIVDKMRESQTPSPSFSNRISDLNGKSPRSSDIMLGGKFDESSRTPYEARVAFDENDDLPQAQILKWRKKREERRRQSFYDNVPGGIESGNLSPKAQPGDTFKFDQNINSPRSETSSSHGSLQAFHKSQGSNELQNDIGSRCSYASSSDSASRDEGFETMSGTVSQRTSLSSTLESEYLQNYSKKQEPMSKLQINENIIAANARASVHDTKKQRTESWTESVAINAGNINKDSSLDSSLDYSVTSPDSGHETMKDEVWAEQSDLESTIKSKSSSVDLNESRPISPLSQTGSVKKGTKKVPSYMRGTASSSTKKSRSDSASSDTDRRTSMGTPGNKSNRLSRGSSNQSLSKGGRTGSNTSLVSTTSNASEKATSSVKRRTSHGISRDRPSSVHSSMPGSRSTTPLPVQPRSQTPLSHKVAAKPAAHASSTIGARNPVNRSTPTVNKTTKTKPAPPPPSGKAKTPTSTPNRSTTPIQSRLRSTTPVNRPTTPSSLRSTTPSVEEEPVPPERLRRTQSMRASSSNRPSLGGSPASKDSPAKSTTPRRSFMSPTASSKARLDKLKAEEDTPPTPPPRRSKDTDSLPSKSDTAPSPLKRHSSLRLPNRNKVGQEQEKSDSKIKGFIQKIGGSGSRIRPASDCSGTLAPVAETSEKEGADDTNTSKDSAKSPSFRKILGLKAKDKTPKKSNESVKK